MIEPLFGSASPMWPGVSYVGSAWPQGPLQIMPGVLPFANRSLAGTVGGFAPAPQIPLSYVPQPVGASGPPVTLPAPGSDIVPPAIAPALVAAVAMRRGQPGGPTSDQDIEDFIYDALELLPSTGDVEVRCDGGRTTLTGAVHNKRLKREVGEIAWSIQAVSDVQNNVTIAARRRARGGPRDAETQGPVAARK